MSDPRRLPTAPEGERGAMSRREAVKVLGVAPVLAALGLTSAHVERAAARVAALPGHYRALGQEHAPDFFDEHQWRTVRVLVDYVIPRDDRSGSATDAKVPEFMDFMLADEITSEQARTAMRDGLAWLDTESRRRFGRPFVEAEDAQRRAILDDIAWPARAPAGMEEGVAFFNRVRDMTASGFFSSEMGWRDLQYIGHTFVPEWNGCPPEALAKLGVDYDLMETRVAPDDRR